MGKLNGIFVATDDEVEAEISSIRLDIFIDAYCRCIFIDAYCRCESTMNLRSTVTNTPSRALRLWTPCSHLDP